LPNRTQTKPIRLPTKYQTTIKHYLKKSLLIRQATILILERRRSKNRYRNQSPNLKSPKHQFLNQKPKTPNKQSQTPTLPKLASPPGQKCPPVQMVRRTSHQQGPKNNSEAAQSVC
jgi:hypothetical protein